jgi:hypothetical protein
MLFKLASQNPDRVIFDENELNQIKEENAEEERNEESENNINMFFRYPNGVSEKESDFLKGKGIKGE